MSNIIITFIIGFILGFIFQNPVSEILMKMVSRFTKYVYSTGVFICNKWNDHYELTMLRIILKKQRPDLRTEDERVEEANKIIRQALIGDGKDPNDDKYFKFKKQ